jgi:hypothetical protein
VSWGDPFDKFYKDDGEVRRESIVHCGLLPGALVSYGQPGVGNKPLLVWDFPDLKSGSRQVLPGYGVVIGVDCESDPTTDWLFLLLNTPARVLFGWLPTSMVRRVG